ncbi:hypothetical protein ACFL2C_03705, partial [Patescibacteria group bacterium]
MSKLSGIAHLVPIIVVAVIAMGLVAITPSIIKTTKTLNNQNTQTTPEAAPTPTPTEPTPTPTLTPTLTPTPTPTPSPTPTPQPIPTATPIPAPVVQAGSPGAGHSRYTIGTERGSFIIDVVSINMAGVRMITDTASDGECGDNCPTLPLSDYIARNNAFAGMNG